MAGDKSDPSSAIRKDSGASGSRPSPQGSVKHESPIRSSPDLDSTADDSDNSGDRMKISWIVTTILMKCKPYRVYLLDLSFVNLIDIVKGGRDGSYSFHHRQRLF